MFNLPFCEILQVCVSAILKNVRFNESWSMKICVFCTMHRIAYMRFDGAKHEFICIVTKTLSTFIQTKSFNYDAWKLIRTNKKGKQKKSTRYVYLLWTLNWNVLCLFLPRFLLPLLCHHLVGFLRFRLSFFDYRLSSLINFNPFQSYNFTCFFVGFSISYV